MPHKRNPITCERITGLARLVRSNAMAALENVALWHERDISHSSVERVILPDSAILLHYMLRKAIRLIDQLIVYPEKMREHVELTHGLIFSQSLLLALAKKGMTREEAYALVQNRAMQCWESGSDFKQTALVDPSIGNVLSKNEIEACFDLKNHLRNVDQIFKRVGL